MRTPLMLDGEETKLPCGEPTCEDVTAPFLGCKACWGTGYVSPSVLAATRKRIKEANDADVHEGR